MSAYTSRLLNMLACLTRLSITAEKRPVGHHWKTFTQAWSPNSLSCAIIIFPRPSLFPQRSRVTCWTPGVRNAIACQHKSNIIARARTANQKGLAETCRGKFSNQVPQDQVLHYVRLKYLHVRVTASAFNITLHCAVKSFVAPSSTENDNDAKKQYGA